MLTVTEARENGWEGDSAEEFVAWLTEFDSIVQVRIGLSYDDLPDWDFASAFEDGDTPARAVEAFLEYVQYDCGMELFI